MKSITSKKSITSITGKKRPCTTCNTCNTFTTSAFTLVELLVVISIIGILSVIGLVTFTSAQIRSRDAQRKSDLKQISSALELFYADYGKYPNDSVDGKGNIMACSYNSVTGVGTVCTWGTSEFKDVDGSGNTKTTYFKVLPKDPASGEHYFYRIVDSPSNQKFQLFAFLENSQDPSKISTSRSCGTAPAQNCNFSVTSSNTSPSD